MNSKNLLKTLVFLSATFFISFSAQAEGLDQTKMMLNQAMMDSNKDYNTHKKKMMDEEYDRVDHWGDRDTQSISIGATAGETFQKAEMERVNGEYMAKKGRDISSEAALLEQQ